tara:strand:- start:18522 stop:19382 length:861 start_codon:yes stop_codon:yes gene_type:complete
MKKNILVTGGAGFIGSNLCKELSKSHKVWSIDNYSNGSEENHYNGVVYINDNTININKHFSKNQFDYIFHLGEYARVEQSFEDFGKVLSYNYHSFPKVVEFAKNKNAKLIYSGSSTKFSVGKEDGKSMSPYAYTKAQNTEFLKNYSLWYGLKYTIVYFYNAYGDDEVSDGKYATVIAKFLKLRLDGDKTLPVTKPGTQVRNFTHIDDIISGLVVAGFEGSGDEFGIGSDEKYSILDVVKLLDCKPVFIPEKKGNRNDGVLKTDKLKKLGWSAKKSLRDYLTSKLKN